MATLPLDRPLSPNEQRVVRLLLEERQTRDPLRQYTPHTAQLAFIRAVLQGPLYENWAITANRWGKSDAGAYCGATLARYGIEPTRPAVGATTTVWDRATSGWIVGPDNETMAHTIVPKYIDNGNVAGGASHPPFIPPWEVERWNHTTQSGRLKNGSIIQTRSNEQKQLKFSAAGVDWIHFDEEPEYPNYEECTLRIEAGRRLRIFGTCTLLPPEGQVGGVSWLFSQIIQPFLRGVGTVGVHGGSIYDNHHLLGEEIDRLESKYPIGSVSRRIRLGGEWLPGIGGARKYTGFSHPVHVRPQGPPDPYRPLCWWWDFNVAPLCAGVGQFDGRIFRGFRELVLDEGSIPEMVDLFRSCYPTHPHEIWIYGDASNPRSVQTRQSDYQLILNEMRTFPSPTRLKVPSANPLVNDRVNSVNAAFKDEFGTSRVEIDPSMVELVADFEQVLDDGRGGIKKTTNLKDPYSRRTHISDAWGYWINREAPVRSRPRHQGQDRSGRVGAAPGYGWRK